MSPAESEKPSTISVWDIHKNEDALLASRQNTFFIAQTFLITGFVTVAAAKNSLSGYGFFMAMFIALLAIYISIIYLLINISNKQRLHEMKKILIEDKNYKNFLFSGTPIEFSKRNKKHGDQFRSGLLTSAFLIHVPLVVVGFWIAMLATAFGIFFDFKVRL